MIHKDLQKSLKIVKNLMKKTLILLININKKQMINCKGK